MKIDIGSEGLKQGARPDQASAELRHWLQAQIQRLSWQVDGVVTLAPLSGDAGFRRYFRILGVAQRVLLVLSPPATENNRLFVELGTALRQCGLATPEVYAFDEPRGWLIIEDFGDNLLSEQLTEGAQVYDRAFAALLTIWQAKPECVLPVYDAAMLQSELDLFGEWFVASLLQQPSLLRQTNLQPAYDHIISNALRQPQGLVHRDYHSRNLIERPGQPLAVIDYQGACWGPITYDLVSLLKDCYHLWPLARVRQWLAEYQRLAEQRGLLAPMPETEFWRWFELMGLQRHIKVLGIFARLSLRDHKHHYLKDLPRVLYYVQSTAARYPEMRPVQQLLADLSPVIKQHSWFAEVQEPAA